jgi:hypothetical protein
MKKHDLLIHNIASKYILGESVNIEIKGNQKQLQKLSELLDTSKSLFESLSNKNFPLEKVMELVEHKKRLADEFYQLSGIKWKL